MGVVVRRNSPFFWVNLERPGQRPIRESTKVPIKGATPAQAKENRRLADAVYAARMGDLARARHQLPTDKARATFRTYRAWYLEHISVHKRNEEREASMLRQLARTFDELDLSTIDLDRARAWRTARSREVSPSTVNRELALLKHLLGAAVPKYLERNPLAGFGQLRVPEREKRVLEPEEERRLLAALKPSPEDTTLVLCALDTLQRLSSVADLRRSQDHGTYLTFLNTKTKGGKVPVSRRLRSALDSLLRTLPTSGTFLFPSYQVGTVGARRNAVIRMFGAACDQALVKDFTFHALRHTGASRMLAAGVDVETVRRIGGWANLRVLQQYLHPSDEASRQAVNAIAPRRRRN